LIPAQTPVATEEILDEALLEETPTEETLERAILLDDALDSVTLLDDEALDEVVASHAPKSVHALSAAQPTPGS
jgi:hypothetical protein